MTFIEVYDTIQSMKQKYQKCGYATKIFHRDDYHEVLCVLGNEMSLGLDKTAHVKVNIQDGIITVSLRRKKWLLNVMTANMPPSIVLIGGFHTTTPYAKKGMLWMLKRNVEILSWLGGEVDDWKETISFKNQMEK